MFTRSTINIRDILRGYASIKYKVEGYWSSETINIYVDRRTNWDTGRSYWKASVNHSTGGRDKEQVADDNQATRNFATALMDAAYQADLIMAQSEGLELAYKAKVKAQELKKIYDEAEFQAKLEKDPAFGMDFASKVIDNMRQEIKDKIAKAPMFPHSICKTFRSRVTNQENDVWVYSTDSVKNPQVRIKINGNVIGVKAAKEFVANMSANNTIAAKLVA
jgi:hypothetical protein